MVPPATVTSEAAIHQSITESVSESIAVKQAILDDPQMLNSISVGAEIILAALRDGRRVFLIGNGGSAADAQHIAAEFVGRYRRERRALPVMALTVNTSALTAVGNDYGFETVFTRQIEAYARPGDVLIAISTSGNSRNILRALLLASALRLKTIALTGKSGGKLKDSCDLCLRVPSEDIPRIQECHILIGHIFSEIVESELFA
jgi:D-sedoheptulose 7-phosphate isomerase